MISILERLDRSRWKPVLGCRPGALGNAGQELSVEVIELKMPQLRRSLTALTDWYAGARRIAALVSRCHIHAIYSNTVRASVYASLAAAWVRVPFLWHMRDFWLTETAPVLPVMDRLGKMAIGAGSKLILTNSQAVADFLPFQKKVHVVHNGIDVRHFSPSKDRNECRSLFGIPPTARVIGAVGRLRPWKGFERAIRITARILERDSRVYFLLAGGSPFVSDDYAEHLLRLAEELNIAERVVLTGHLEDVRPALAAMDVFVHPGDPEPFGLVNVEAMSMQLPVVAFAQGALPEIVLHEETGVLVPPGDESELTTAVLRVLSSPEQQARMGRAGRERAAKFFSAERMVAEVSESLSQLIS